jgi:hypothetical protein
MASNLMQWMIRIPLLIAGLLMAVAIWYFASWAAQAANPLRHELLMGSAVVLIVAFPFSLVAAALARWKREEISARVSSLTDVVAGANIVLVLVVAFIN